MSETDITRQKLGQQAGIVILISNLVLFVFKYIAGMISNSVSIQADAVNNLTDTVSAAITVIGFRIAARPKDKKHPYGYGRMEYLAGLGIACVILCAGVLLLKQSVMRILHPQQVTIENLFVLLIPAAAFLIKLGLALYSNKLNAVIRSAAIGAIKKDCLFDALTTLLTLITLGLSQITPLPADALFGLAISGLIIYNGVMSAKENISLLLGNSLDVQTQHQIELSVGEYSEFSGIKSVITNDFGPDNQIVAVELVPNENFNLEEIQNAADALSLTLEMMFDFKIIIYWNSKRTDTSEQNKLMTETSGAQTAAEKKNAQPETSLSCR